jgi:hypothetical protein
VKGKTLKKRAFLPVFVPSACAVAALFMAGCAELHTKIPVLDSKDAAAAPQQWERYGAYYIIDDCIVSMNAAPDFGAADAEFTVYKKIRILTTKGLSWATVPVWRYGDRLALFECTVIDAAGRGIPVQTSELREKYEASGTVVVPKVTKGSTITLRMVFTQRQAPAIYEHWFTRFIPVRSARLVLHTDSAMRFAYTYKSYGARAEVRKSSTSRFGGSTISWQVTNLEPANSLPYSCPISESEPRVELRINPLYGSHGNIISNWNEMAGFIDQMVVEPALDNSEEEIGIKAAEIVMGKKSGKTRAVAIVEWVQQNIVCGPGPSAAASKISDLLHGGKSDMLLASLLCKELLKAAGVRSELILTRAHSRGGFDPGMLTYTGCREGILIATFDSATYAIMPSIKGYPIGTYPADYFDLSGLNMSTYGTVKLPKPRWNRFDERVHVTLSFSSDTAPQTMSQSFFELSMPPVRQRLARQSEARQREVVESLMSRGRSISLQSYSIKGLGDYDPEITVLGRFKCSSLPSESAGALRYDLSQYVNSLFADIDSTRHEDIVVTVPAIHIDTLEIRKENGIQVSFDASPWQFADSLFSARICVEQSASSLLFIREVSTRSVMIPKSRIKAIVNDIRQLDRASRVTAIVKIPRAKK